MTQDLNKGITNIGYNHLNLVNSISLPNNRSLVNSYDAAGAKLDKKYLNSGTPSTTTDYLGGFQYSNGNLLYFPTPEGYVIKSGSSYKYVYIYSDHLGNNRVSYLDDNSNGSIQTSEIISNRNYYPFGMAHSGQYVDGLSASYKYTFQGKEYQDEDGVDWHDFGSRMFDPALGRWMTKDPQNQFGSPYVALGNNPINSIDPDGEFALLPVLVGAFVGGSFGAIQAENGNAFNGFWKGALVGALGGTIGQFVTSGSFFASIASGIGTGSVTGAFDAALNGEAIFQGALNGGVFGGITAGISSSIESFKNLTEYGRFGTHDGTLKHLYAEAQEAVVAFDAASFDDKLKFAGPATKKMQATLDYFTNRYGGMPMETSVWTDGNITSLEMGDINISVQSFRPTSVGIGELKSILIHEQAHFFNDRIVDDLGLGVDWKDNSGYFDYDGRLGYGSALEKSGKFRIPRAAFTNSVDQPFAAPSWNQYKQIFGKSNFSRFVNNIPRRGHLFGFRLYVSGNY